MKPDTESIDDPNVTGDVIGDTAYSERFVLKILLKLANLDSLKDEFDDKSFEDDICTLWDMTAERDVVLFLLKHNVLNIFNFALPVIDSPRFIEIVVGIIGNMCCQREAVAALFKMSTFLSFLLDYIKIDDSLILIQLLRLVSSCLFLADNDDISEWMNLFIAAGYSTALYFILKNSSNKELLVTALENFNTISSYCNTEKSRKMYYEHFVSKDSLESVTTGFVEVTVNQKQSCTRDELERILVISLQITLNLIGFDKSVEKYDGCKENIITIISNVLKYYEAKLIEDKEVDTDLVDVIESTNTIVKMVSVSDCCEPDKYFDRSYSMWTALKSISKEKNNEKNFENGDGDKEEMQEFAKTMNAPLSTLLCTYMEKCSNENLLKVLDKLGNDYEVIVESIEDTDIKRVVSERTSDYWTRLRETVHS